MVTKQRSDTLGDRIKRQRNNLKLTQSSVARKVGVADSHMSIWERNCGSPNLKNLAALSKALKCSTDYLINGGKP